MGSRRDGRKILDISWEKNGVEIKVPVKAITKEDFHTGKEEMTFRAIHEPSGLDVTNRDINLIREEVLKALDAWYSIQWELFFMVEVSGGDRGHGGYLFEIGFELEFFLVGKDSMGNARHLRIPRPEDVSVDPKEMTHWAGESARGGLPETGKKCAEKWRGGRLLSTRSLVRATAANVDAADRFVAAMAGLLARMHEHFAPNRIEQLLERAANLLPAPSSTT